MASPVLGTARWISTRIAAVSAHGAAASYLWVMLRGLRAATTAMRCLRYLRRPAARRMVSSETLGPVSFSPTRWHKFLFGSVAWSGTPFG
jgi:hypothetical protein